MSIKIATPNVKFNIKDRPEFFREVLKRVNKHFKDNNISKFANLKMKFKTTFMILLYFIPMGILFLGVVTTTLPVLAMWVLMGFGMSGIGLSIMHDANHGAYSKNKTVNNRLGFLINFIGAYDVNWKIQHNVLHHSFTNIEGLDGDIENPIMRFSPNQEKKKAFKYQAFYAPFLYAIMTLYWFLSKDFERISRYTKKGLMAKQKLTYGQAMRNAIFYKIWYLGLTLFLPIFLIPLPWYEVVLGFILMHVICGLILALIFQPAHVIEETSFFVVDENSSVENNWAIHQMKTTSNFANESTLFSWFIGGLNFQVEHHLFPTICHIHYKSISKIVKATALEFDVPYHEHKTFWGALKSHFSMLHSLGTGSYDEKKLI